jgi:hypothetical protein
VTAASAVLARLSAIGARVECRDDRVFVRAGRLPVPRLLIEDARAAKVELSKMLVTAPREKDDEHLRGPDGSKAAETLTVVEDAHLSTFDEHLRETTAEDTHPGAEDPHPAEPPDSGGEDALPVVNAPEDAHSREAMSTFDETEDFYEFRGENESKMLIRSPLRVDEHCRRPNGREIAQTERAAIVEHNAGIPRDWAAGCAALDPQWPPGDMPPRRWGNFVEDVGCFLNSPWAKQAAALGWGANDLFGCDRDRPFARIDSAGLVWLLRGERVVALTEEVAVIEMHTGARQTYHRRPRELGRVLAWELIPRRRHHPPTAK